MGLLDTLFKKFIGPPTCGDEEHLSQPGDWVDVKCALNPAHSGNHFDRRYRLQWGDDPLQKMWGEHPERFKDRP